VTYDHATETLWALHLWAAVNLHSEAMVVGSYLNLASLSIEYRLIDSTVPERQLVGFKT
jgi:hypothetical protein